MADAGEALAPPCWICRKEETKGSGNFPPPQSVGENANPGAAFAACSRLLLGSETGEFVLDSKFLFFEGADFKVVGKGTVVFFFDGVFKSTMFGLKGLDTLVKTHGRFLPFK
jgi:hypothetical protein